MEAFVETLSLFMTFESLMLVIVGCLIALFMGLLPGLSGAEAMLILLPFTFRMPLFQAMLLMMSAYAGAFVGGAVTGILFGIPGCSTTIVTVFDGFPMRKQGRAFVAIGAAATASAVAGLLALLLTVAVMPLMVPFSLMFGPPEWFVFVLFGLVVLALAGEGRFLRALASGFLGILVGCIGLSIVTGDVRFTFGTSYLWGGIPIIPAFIGLYPLAEVIDLTFLSVKNKAESDSLEFTENFTKNVWEGILVTFKKKKALVIGTITGWIIGVIPGVGGALANLMAYVLTKETSKEPETFGKGNVEGVVAAESGNNASVGGALIPTLALGIPGSVNTAILLGILLLHGIQPGTNVFEKYQDITWAIILSAAASTIFASVFVLIIGWRVAKVIHRIEIRYAVPVIVIIGSIAAYLTRGNVLDVVTAFVLALVGYGMKRFEFSRISFMIALMLGPLMEKSYFQALSIGRGSLKIFIQSPVVNILWVCVFIIMLASAFRSYRAKKALKHN